MNIQYTSTKGIRIANNEKLVSLADSINNDIQIVKKFGWKVTDTQAVLSRDFIIITQPNVSPFSIASYIILPTVVSELYSVSATIIDADVGAYYIGVSTTLQATPNIGNMDATFKCSIGHNTLVFTAAASLTYVYLIDAQQTDKFSKWKTEIELRLANVTSADILDISGQNLDLTITGQLTKHVANHNSDTLIFTDFDGSNYAQQAYNFNLDYAQDFFYRFWIKTRTVNPVVIFDRLDSASGGILSNGNVAFSASDSGALVDSGIEVNDNTWHMVIIQRQAGIVSAYVDLNKGNTFGDSNDLSNTVPLFLGIDNTLNNSLVDSEIALFSSAPGYLTDAEMLKIYNSERELFGRDSVYKAPSAISNYSVDTAVADYEVDHNRKVVKTVDGNSETNYLSEDRMWNMQTVAIHDSDVKYAFNCFNSIAQGQLINFDPYGSLDSPTQPRQGKMDNNKVTQVRIESDFWYNISFEIKEENT